MLPPGARMRTRRDFAAALGGRRHRGPRVVVYWRRDALSRTATGDRFCAAGSRGAHPVGEIRVGLVVGRVVGPAVVRSTVKRRIRHVVRSRLALVPADTLVVVRALPAAAQASSTQLGDDLDAALARMQGAESRRGRPGGGAGRRRADGARHDEHGEEAAR